MNERFYQIWIFEEIMSHQLHFLIKTIVRLDNRGEQIFYFCLAELSLVDISQKNQIITLSVDGDLTYKSGLTVYHTGNLFSRILNMYTNVLHLKFYQSTYSSHSFVKFSTHTPKFCSTLVELHINVQFFDDCLYLLDGRLNQLRRFFVSAHIISLPQPINDKRVSYEQKENKCILQTWINSFLGRNNSVEAIFVVE